MSEQSTAEIIETCNAGLDDLKRRHAEQVEREWFERPYRYSPPFGGRAEGIWETVIPRVPLLRAEVNGATVTITGDHGETVESLYPKAAKDFLKVNAQKGTAPASVAARMRKARNGSAPKRKPTAKAPAKAKRARTVVKSTGVGSPPEIVQPSRELIRMYRAELEAMGTDEARAELQRRQVKRLAKREAKVTA